MDRLQKRPYAFGFQCSPFALKPVLKIIPIRRTVRIIEPVAQFECLFQGVSEVIPLRCRTCSMECLEKHVMQLFPRVVKKKSYSVEAHTTPTRQSAIDCVEHWFTPADIAQK